MTLVFTSPESQKWFIPVADDAPRTYEMAITWHLADGSERNSHAGEAREVGGARSAGSALSGRTEMLYLGGGMRQVKAGEGVALNVLPDFSDPNLFYYLPNFPHIAKMEDGVPAIRLLVYREDLDTIPDNAPEATAFLSLDVDLAWPPEVLDEAASKLRLEDQLAQKPRLTPIFFTKGSVKLMLLDAVTQDDGAAQPGGDARPTAFVTRSWGPARRISSAAIGRSSRRSSPRRERPRFPGRSMASPRSESSIR